jgi:hypothetical protein
METLETSIEKRKPRRFSLHPFTVCSSCKRKFVVCLFVDKETNGSYPFANGLDGLNGFAHLCTDVTQFLSKQKTTSAQRNSSGSETGPLLVQDPYFWILFSSNILYFVLLPSRSGIPVGERGFPTIFPQLANKIRANNHYYPLD